MTGKQQIYNWLLETEYPVYFSRPETGYEFPCIVYSLSSAEVESTVKGEVGKITRTFDIDVYAVDSEDATDISDEVIETLEGRANLTFIADIPDDDVSHLSLRFTYVN